ncbi:MAG: response regulator transcription factor [Chloroflexota bacterium]
MRILLVEDELPVARAVMSSLVAEGYAVDYAADADTALDHAAVYPYDLVILDRVLPGASGLTVAQRLRSGRADNATVPILMLTAMGAIDDRVVGLDHGADDYLVKPFAMAELLARVRALRRRETFAAPLVQFADLELDPALKRVTRAGRPVDLTSREFALLEVLARHPGQVYSQERLIDAVWDAEFEASSNVVEVYIRSLRRKLDGGRRDGLIRTVRGAGYRLEEPPTRR